MLAWLVVEALLDYILKIDFRQVRWMVISYVTLFFAAAGGISAWPPMRIRLDVAELLVCCFSLWRRWHSSSVP